MRYLYFLTSLFLWAFSMKIHAATTPCPEEVFDGKYFRLLSFRRLPTDAERKHLERLGVRLVDYRHPMTYYAVVDAAFGEWEAVPALRKVAPVPLSLKYNPVFDEGIPPWAREGEMAKVVVAYYRGLSAPRVRRALEGHGMRVVRELPFAFQVEGLIPSAEVPRWAALPFVQYVDLASPPPRPEENNYYFSGINRSNVVHQVPGKDYSGKGLRMMVSEGGRISSLMNLTGRLWVWDSNETSSDHASHVALYAASAAITDPTSNAPAWGATIISDDFPTPYDSNYVDHDVLYTNHSLGFGIYGGYDAHARALDLLTENHPEVAVFFSAGNSGTSTGFSPYNFSGWANITGQRKQNKNHFASGAVDQLGDLLYFSSRGPMYDGRLYPLVVNEGYDGTSYSSPRTMGSVALLQDVWKDYHNDSLAPAVLLRAIIAATADDILNPGPDYKSGFGIVNMRRAYEVVRDHRIVVDSISNNDVDSFTVNVPAGLHEFRVLLMWPDPAAPIGASKALINDLDLELVAPNGQVYRPWVLNAYPDPDSLDADAVRKVDTLNNVELVSVSSPMSGTWKVRIRGSMVPMGPQPYFVVYEPLQPGLTVTFPHQGAALLDDEPVVIYWDYYGAPGTFTIKYQLDGGAWQTISSGAWPYRRAYRWTPPSVGPGLHKLRIMVGRGNFSDTSDIVTITAKPPSDLASECAPGRITWHGTSADSAYRVLYLDSVRLRPIDSGISINGTSASITALPPTSYYLTVAAAVDSYVGYWQLPVKVDLSAPRYTYPVTKGFENEATGSSDLAGGWSVTPSSGGYTWTVNAGSTPSTGTGPSSAAVGQKYIYTEATIGSVTAPQVTYLTSPCIDEGGGYLSFYYHMYGSQMGDLYVEGWDSASASWAVFDSIIGQQHLSGSASWTFHRVMMGGLTAPYRVRFRAVRGSGYRSDIALDSITLYPAEKQLTVARLLSPASGCALTASEPLAFVLSNPSVPIDAGDTVTYRVFLDGQQVCQQVIYAPRVLAYSDTLHVLPSCSLDLSATGAHPVEIQVTIGSSTTTYSTTLVTQPLISQLPYREDFENGKGGWEAQSEEGKASTWEWGNPGVGGSINTAAGGTHAWETLLDDGYSNDEAGWVLSPCFDLAALEGPAVFFEADVWWDAERGYDGAAVDTLTSVAGQWGRLGTVGQGRQWYNDRGIEGLAWSGNTGGWTGNASNIGSRGWVKARWTFLLPDTVGYLQFRMLFGSDNSVVSGDGMAFDNVRVGNLGNDIGVDSLLLPAVLECDQVSRDLPVRVRLVNSGLPLSAATSLTYQVFRNGQRTCQGTAALGMALGQDDSLIWTIPGCRLRFDSGTYDVAVDVELASVTEMDTTDNRRQSQVQVPPYRTLPYREGFENGPAGWMVLTVGPRSSWAWGAPNGGTIDRAYEGSKIWKTGRNGGYLDDEAGYVLSPCFVVPDGVDSFRFSAGVWWDSYRQYDGGAIDIYQNGQWQHLNGAFPQNWYTIPVSALENRWGIAHRYGWSGQSHFWKDVRTRINTSGADTIRLRFVFAVDGAGTSMDGLAFDDVRLTPAYPSGIGEKPKSIRWRIYPVPARHVLWMAPASPVRNVTVTLYAMDGKPVLTRSWKNGHAGPWRLALPADLPAGTYQLRIISPDDVLIRPVMIVPAP